MRIRFKRGPVGSCEDGKNRLQIRDALGNVRINFQLRYKKSAITLLSHEAFPVVDIMFLRGYLCV